MILVSHVILFSMLYFDVEGYGFEMFTMILVILRKVKLNYEYVSVFNNLFKV